MTKRSLPVVLVALGWSILLCTQPARAQLPYTRPATSPYVRPPISPYLNLLRGGNPAINYYGVVRPEQQFYNAFQQLNQQAAANQQQLSEIEAQAALPTTGHPAYFMNVSHYYLSGTGQRPQTRSPTTTSTSAMGRPSTGNSATSLTPRR